ncbi:18S rRNA pseudouridine methyltransferase [Bulinus truncatus]|nr:18S rRNA pseudouridine methyltransferase [Bulinus truncatus]
MNHFINSKIGYPEELNNDTYLEEYYSNLTFNKEMFFENIFINERESFYENLRQLRLPIDKEKWNIPPSTVNAYYSSVMNQIFFPAGILQPPFFSKTYPKSLNFGGIGVVIGHEITHGFDDRGRQYDKFGNLIQWWSPNAVEKFKVKAQCIVEQYGNFTVKEVNAKLNGVNTQGENIADNGGLKQAYKV